MQVWRLIGCGLALAGATSAAVGCEAVGGVHDTELEDGGGLTGTWDLVATSKSGGTTTGTVVLGRDTFELTLPGRDLSYSVNGNTLDVAWKFNGDTNPIVATRTPAAMDLGIIPLDIGGNWSFSSPNGGERCVASLSATVEQASCNSNISGWPDPLPIPQPMTQYNAVRTQQLASVFGDLGGTWQATDGSGGSPGSCEVTFRGSTFSANCNDESGSLLGTVQLTFNGANSTASGTTSYGVELSAQKQ